MGELERLKKSFADLQVKSAKQRNEIAQLTQHVEKATQLVEEMLTDKRKLLSDLKRIRGEK